MTRRLVVLPSLLALALTCLVAGARATPAGSPFYLVPSTTKECRNLAHCFGITGLWVVVPAHGQASYLIGCPARSATRGQFLLGGTDARASSTSVRVWFDGQLGAPIGTPTAVGPTLLFHAVTFNGRPASFQPVLGCISLKQATKRSTVSARRADAPPVTPRSAPAPNKRATNLILEPGWTRTVTISCLKRERLAGNWSGFAFGTEGPPDLRRANNVTIETRTVGNSVRAVIHTGRSIPYLIHVQIGTICEP